MYKYNGKYMKAETQVIYYTAGASVGRLVRGGRGRVRNMQRDPWVTDDGLQMNRTEDQTIRIVGERRSRTISPPNLSGYNTANTRRDTPSVPSQVPPPTIPRRVLSTSPNPQMRVPEEDFRRELSLVGGVQVNIQRASRVLRPQRESGIDWGVYDFEAHWCVARAGRDFVGPSGRDLLLGLCLDRDESEIGVDWASGGGDVDDRSAVGAGGVTDHGDARVDGSRLGLEDQLVLDGEVSADGTIGNFEFAIFAFDSL